jgi:NifU-like protein involved in Fe-S cluster formation
VATEWVKGMNIDEATKIKNTEIANHLNLPPVKLHCSMLAEDAIKAAVTDFKKKRDAAKA